MTKKKTTESDTKEAEEAYTGPDLHYDNDVGQIMGDINYESRWNPRWNAGAAVGGFVLMGFLFGFVFWLASGYLFGLVVLGFFLFLALLSYLILPQGVRAWGLRPITVDECTLTPAKERS